MNLTDHTVMRSCYKPGKISSNGGNEPRPKGDVIRRQSLPSAVFQSIGPYFTSFIRPNDGFSIQQYKKTKAMPGIRVSTVKFNYHEQSRSQLTPRRPVMVPRNESAACPGHKMEFKLFQVPKNYRGGTPTQKSFLHTDTVERFSYDLEMKTHEQN